MTTSMRYEVIPVEPGWQISRNGRPFLTVQTKQVAVEEALTQARNTGPSRLVLKRRDGSVEDEAHFDSEGSATSPASQEQHGRAPSIGPDTEQAPEQERTSAQHQT